MVWDLFQKYCAVVIHHLCIHACSSYCRSYISAHVYVCLGSIICDKMGYVCLFIMYMLIMCELFDYISKYILTEMNIKKIP